MRHLSSFIACVVAGLLTVGPLPVYATAPEEIASPETMSSQSMTGEEVAAPFMLTGESLVGMVQNVVGFDVPGSSIVFYRKTGQIYVRNTPANQETISQILDSLRASIKRQVQIEARIISVSSTDFNGLGLDSSSWQFINSNNRNLQLVSGDMGGHSSMTPPTRADYPDLNTAFSTSQVGGNLPLQIYRAGLVDMDATIDALSRKTDVNTLAAPRITVFNNQRANIAIEKKQYYVSAINSSFTGSEGKYTVAQDPDVKLARSGTLLDVTPTINDDGSITLELHPNYVTVDLTNVQVIEKPAGGANDSVTLPKYTAQEINTTVTVVNGGVVVLGGLITEEEINEHDTVPILGSIPLIGKLLFQSNQVRNVKTHLLMFVKATTKDAKPAYTTENAGRPAR